MSTIPYLSHRLGIMRKALFATVLATLFFHLQCKKDGPVTLFDMTYVLQFDLPAALNTVQTHFVEFPKVPTRIEDLLAENQRMPEDVGVIEPYVGTLETVLFPEDLSFFREIFVEFLDGSQRYECFYTPNVPFNAGQQLTLVGTIADFRTILMESAMHLRIGFRLREPSPSAHTYNLRLTFKAKA